MNDTGDSEPPESSLAQRLSALREELMFARRLYVADRADPADCGRTGVRLALGAVIKSLDTLDFGKDALEPLRAAFHALTDADEGRRNSLFRPPPVAVNRPLNLDVTVALHAAAAAALEIGMTINKQQDAAKAVANALSRGGFSLPGKTHVTPRAVILWRDNFSGCHGGIPGAAQYEKFVHAMQQGDIAPEKAVSGRSKTAHGATAAFAVWAPPKIHLSPHASGAISRYVSVSTPAIPG
jgi:hypothetical protein